MYLGSTHRLVSRKSGGNDSRTVKEIIGMNFAKCYFRGFHRFFFFKSENCSKTLGASRMTRHKFHTDNHQILGANIQNSFVRATWRTRVTNYMHSWSFDGEVKVRVFAYCKCG
jgi:hypothetical protein